MSGHPAILLVPYPAASFTPAPLAEGLQPIYVGADMAIPLPDRCVDHVEVSMLVQTVAAARVPALLVECRRVLRPGGRVACGPANSLPIARWAALVGLESDARDADRPDDPNRCTFRKPERGVAGEPMVSIVIPAFAPRFFAATLASAVGQTWQPLEIVICDDSEADEIRAIAQQAARERPVRYFRNETRLGTRANLARGLAEARGEFVKYLNDDDLLAADCVATLMDGFRRAPDIVLASSWRRRIDAGGRPLADQPATVPIAGQDIVVAGVSLANAMLLAGLNIVGEPSSVMFRRSDFADGDPFGFDGVPARGAVDMAMWATLLLRGNAVWYRRALSEFRIHPAQSQQDPAKRLRAVEGIRSLQHAWLALGFPEHLRATEVLAQPFPPSPDDGWHWHPVPALASIAQSLRQRPPSDGWRYGVSPTTALPPEKAS